MTNTGPLARVKVIELGGIGPGPHAAFYRTYQTSDGGYMAVGSIEPQSFALLVAGLGFAPDEVPGQFDFARCDEMRALFAERFADACVTPVLSWTDATADAHLVGRHTLIEANGFEQAAPAPRFSRTPARPVGPPADHYPAERDRLVTMGFTTPKLPDVDPATFLQQPLMDRVKVYVLKWVDHGYGAPRVAYLIYVVKLVAFYVIGGISIATATSGLPAFWHVAQWWDQPIVYQKVIVWTVLLELVGLAGSWGPLAGKTKPMTGGFRFWARLNTIRLRPWRWVPLTAGSRRTWFDIALYVALAVSLVVALVSPPDSSALIDPALLVAPIVLLVLLGLRDKTIFLAARGEQYLPALFFFAVLPMPDMIIALKLLIFTVWFWAGVSKFGMHFTSVIPPMVSNSPSMPLKWLKRAHYRNFPDDVRPSHLATFMAHGPGTVVEIISPLALLFSPWPWLTYIAVAIMVCFHLFIISTFPLAVPLEWNALFAYAVVFLFLGFPNWQGYAVWDTSPPWLAVVLVLALSFFPVLGNLRPDLVSFLPAMRQYAGNWAAALWAFAPGAEAKLDRVTRSAGNVVDQLIDYGYEPFDAELFAQQVLGWRSMHSQGRGLFSVLLKNLPDIDSRSVREGEIVCNTLVGFNFGDGHLHNEELIAAVQEEAAFAPGELVVVWVESQPINRRIQHYKVIDAALGVIERGTWQVADLVQEQPWLPNGPIPLNVTFQST